MTHPLRFVLCPSYHGATALAFLLNNHPSLSCLGDTLPWEGQNQSCSCGARVAECRFWRALRERAGVVRLRGQPQMLPLLPRLFADPWLNRIAARALIASALVPGSPAPWLAGSAGRDFVAGYRRFYTAITELQGTDAVVDGSKSIGKVLALAALSPERQPVQVLHLVRDPRGYAASLMSRGEAPADPAAVGRQWRRDHGVIERLFERLGPALGPFSYRRIRYEDLCLEPAATLAGVFAFFGVPDAPVQHAARDPRKNHIIGNRMLRSFDGRLRLDTRWRDTLDADMQRRILAGAGPTAARYGYR